MIILTWLFPTTNNAKLYSKHVEHGDTYRGTPVCFFDSITLKILEKIIVALFVTNESDRRACIILLLCYYFILSRILMKCQKP